MRKKTDQEIIDFYINKYISNFDEQDKEDTIQDMYLWILESDSLNKSNKMSRIDRYWNSLLCKYRKDKEIEFIDYNNLKETEFLDDNILENHQLKELFEKLFKMLNWKEEQILRHKYNDELTYKEIADYYSTNIERIRRIDQKAIRKLKHSSRSKYLIEY